MPVLADDDVVMHGNPQERTLRRQDFTGAADRGAEVDHPAGTAPAQGGSGRACGWAPVDGVTRMLLRMRFTKLSEVIIKEMD